MYIENNSDFAIKKNQILVRLKFIILKDNVLSIFLYFDNMSFRYYCHIYCLSLSYTSCRCHNIPHNITLYYDMVLVL